MATTVTTPVLIAILATVAGVIIVGVGGGLIRPMQQRWEGYLTTAEREAPRLKAHAEQRPVRTRPGAAPLPRTSPRRAPAPPPQHPVGGSTAVYDQNVDQTNGTGYDGSPRQY